MIFQNSVCVIDTARVSLLLMSFFSSTHPHAVILAIGMLCHCVSNYGHASDSANTTAFALIFSTSQLFPIAYSY
jgi:hypothetical protein